MDFCQRVFAALGAQVEEIIVGYTNQLSNEEEGDFGGIIISMDAAEEEKGRRLEAL